MCKIEDIEGSEEEGERRKRRKRWGITMGLKTFGGEGKKGIEKFKTSIVSKSRMKLWIIRVTTTVLLWICLVQLTALGDMCGPRVPIGWPSCFSQGSALDVKLPPAVPVTVLPPKSECFYFSNVDILHIVCSVGYNNCDCVKLLKMLHIFLS